MDVVIGRVSVDKVDKLVGLLPVVEFTSIIGWIPVTKVDKRLWVDYRYVGGEAFQWVPVAAGRSPNLIITLQITKTPHKI